MANKKHLAILRQGVDVWNQWRKDNPQVKPNLRGANLRNKNFEGINFSKTDIRGANFAKANLIGANFQEAETGLNNIGIILLGSQIWGISAASSMFLLIISVGITTRMSNLYNNISAFGDSFLDQSIPLYNHVRNITNPLLTIIFIAIAILLGIFGTTIYTALIEVSNVSRFFYIFTSIGLVYFTPLFIKEGLIYTAIIPIFCSIIGIFIWFYGTSNRLDWVDKYFSWISKYSIDFVSSIGTNFMYSNLTKSDFTSAMLKNSNFKNALVTHVNWYKAKHLNLSKLDKTILNNEKVLNLLITRNGNNKSYINCNFQGAYLVNANLTNADLELTNINEAIFKNACLEGANLTKSQALNTNFQSADLTGVGIEDWNINNQTNFDNVICKYIYLDKDQKKRSPSQYELNFAPGEFTNFYRQAFTTIELIFSHGVDWQSFLTSFSNEYNSVVNNYNEAVRIIEDKYESQILSKNEQIQEYKEEIKHLRRRIEILNKSILDLSSVSKENTNSEDNV